MRTTLIGSEDTNINKQSWTTVMQARHLGHICMNTEVSSFLNFAPEVLHLLHLFYE